MHWDFGGALETIARQPASDGWKKHGSDNRAPPLGFHSAIDAALPHSSAAEQQS